MRDTLPWSGTRVLLPVADILPSLDDVSRRVLESLHLEPLAERRCRVVLLRALYEHAVCNGSVAFDLIEPSDWRPCAP